MNPSPSLDLVTDVRDMLAFPFMVNALEAGTLVALLAAVAGWYRFAGDALSHVAFVGAIAAAVLGVNVRIGLFAGCLLVAAGMATLGREGRADDVVIGLVFAWVLGIGVLLLALLATSGNAGSGIAATNTLFGSIYSLGAGVSRLAAAIGLLITVGVVAIARPLLLSTLDAELAAARGVPVGALGAVFLAALAVVTAQSTEAVGALLLLGLLAAPAGGAHRLTTSPWRGLALSGTFAVGSMWGGLALAYAIPTLPPSSAVIGLARAIFGGATLVARWRHAIAARSPDAGSPR